MPTEFDNQTDDEIPTNIELKKRLSAFTGAMFIVNYMVGSGIFVTPQFVLLEAGSIGASLIVWLICGIVIICGCLMNVELGCMLPLAGGAYEHMLVGLHRIAAYLFSWTYLILISPAACAAGALSFSNYLLATAFPCESHTFLSIVLSIGCIWIFVVLNTWHIRMVNMCHKGFAIGKLMTLLAIVIMGIYGIVIGGASNFKNPFANTTSEPLKFSLAFHSVIFTFSGWNGLNFLAEELQNPARSLPLASILGLSAVVIFYLLVNVSYLFILTPQEMKDSDATVVTFGAKIWKPLGPIFSVLVSLSILGFVNSEINATSRISYGASRNNQLPCPFRLLTMKQSTPVTSIFVTGILSTLYLAAGEVDILVYMAAFSEATFYVVLVLTFIMLRWKHPNFNRPFKANAVFAIIFALVMIAILVISLIASPKSCAVAAALILSGLIFYPLTIYEKKSWFLVWYHRFTIFLQKLWLSIPGSNSEGLSKYTMDTET
ncbi:hypothetical protein GJ496_003787 [Pomphorhynchus laevis]|nr:hypothetical protein GJ496_003787 [Pomphorhynchus laevis]